MPVYPDTYADLYPDGEDYDDIEYTPRQKIDEDGFLQFGNHEDEHIRTVPTSYLEWILDEFDEGLDENTELINAAEEQIIKRQKIKEAGMYDDSVY